MKPSFAVVFASFALAACQSSGPVPIGPDTYTLSSAGGFFTFSGGSVNADLFREANAFCQSQGRQVMAVNTRSVDSGYGTPAQGTISFRCLLPGDPGLRRPTMQPVPNTFIQTK
jgi:hypothetical protein